ncbi:hypothetical protein [Bradyrhizobium sp. Tv2a-2]|uniref:hypothetical protein n=1 Tax=Bradyrhizobium sp. Tv2a-2 TaxID=113395 RepID=UPI000418C1FB|nr:hypothetical protein [Bradyrhizobium sp. Tv2a-2]
MSKRVFQVSSFTPTAQADGALSAGTWAALKPGSSTDILKIGKMLLMGQASSSAVTATMLARSSSLATTPSALALPNSDGPANIAATAVSTAPVAFVASTGAPNRSPAVGIPRLNLTFNAFGGIIQWQTNPGSEEEWVAVGNNTASNSETLLSSANVGSAGAIGADWFYEVL